MKNKFKLSAGSMVKISGIPFALTSDVIVETATPGEMYRYHNDGRCLYNVGFASPDEDGTFIQVKNIQDIDDK